MAGEPPRFRAARIAAEARPKPITRAGASEVDTRSKYRGIDDQPTRRSASAGDAALAVRGSIAFTRSFGAKPAAFFDRRATRFDCRTVPIDRMLDQLLGRREHLLPRRRGHRAKLGQRRLNASQPRGEVVVRLAHDAILRKFGSVSAQH